MTSTKVATSLHARYAPDGLRPEQTDIDSIQYRLITPDDLANAVVHVIDQPSGMSI